MSRSIYKNNVHSFDYIPKTSNVAIGMRIKQKRKAKGVTAERMAEDLNTYMGKISRLETGKTEIKAGDLVLLSQYLGCSIDYLVTGYEKIPYVEVETREHHPPLEHLMARISELDEETQEEISKAIRLIYKV